MCGELDRLVPPLGGAVDAGDETGPVDASEVADDERVAGLRLVAGPVGQAEVPVGVLLPGVRLQECVLVVRGWCDLAPIAVEDVLVGVDELPSVSDGPLVELV